MGGERLRGDYRRDLPHHQSSFLRSIDRDTGPLSFQVNGNSNDYIRIIRVSRR